MISQLLFNSSWSPANIPTVFWYDAADSSTITASGSEVTQVLDKSGNNRSLTRAAAQSGPLTGTRNLNGLNVFEWTANNCLENAAFTYNHTVMPLNIAMVAQLDASNTQYFLMAGSKSTTAGQRLSLRNRATNTLEVYGGNGSTDLFLTGGVTSANTPYIFLPKFNAASSAWRINGTQTGTGTIGTNSFSILSWGHNEVENFDLDGFIGEMIGFIDNASQEVIEGYLAWKWGIVNNLPEAHPYKTTAPRL